MLLSKLKAELSKRIPNSDVILQGNELKIIIPMEVLVTEFQKNLGVKSMIPIDIEVDNKNIILKFRVM
ncbi:MAG: hypothetical protein DRP11_01925, partial [Candidatus Aenigmatarchaeota archaeon]